MASIVIKVVYAGQALIFGDLSPTMTLQQLQEAIEERTGVFVRKQKLLCKGKVVTALYKPSTPLADAGITAGAKFMLLSAAATTAPSQGTAALQAAQRQKTQAVQERLRQRSITSVPSNANSSMQARAETWAKTGIVALRDLKLVTLPGEMFLECCAAAVRIVDLSGNQLRALPPSIAQLSRLQKLRLSLNALDDAGLAWDAVTSLPSLVVLAIDHNRLTTLPPTITRLTSLQKLALEHNQLATLPVEISALTNLRALNLKSNRLTALPGTLSACAELQELDASDNAIEEIPASLGQLLKLKTLLMDNTRVRQIPPPLFAGAVSLATLSLHGCPITVEELRETPGHVDYEARRRAKYDKQVDMRVLGQGSGFDEGADVREWEKWW